MASSYPYCLRLLVFVIFFVATSETAADLTFSEPRPIENDVFISFQYEDVHSVFLSHLIRDFIEKQITVFVDYKLESEDHEISAAVARAIERSQISVVIFSVNYAYSYSCLEELLKIMECHARNEQIVIPVFYDVDPSYVRHLNGSYGNALVQHEKNQIYGLERLQLWRSALKQTANLSGFHSINFRNDSELLDKLVDYTLMKLRATNLHSVNSKGLVGIEKTIGHIQSLLHQGSGNVGAIGIWGMGGIGKTTIVGEVFHRQCSKFDGCCFLANVREESKRHGIISLKEKLFSTLLNEDFKIDTANGLPGQIKMKLGYMKVLIVLDDVNDSDQLKILARARDWFGPGSRIIITSRDKQVFANEVDHIYEVGALDFENALKLFNMNAFKGDHHHLEMEYSELSNRVVDYAKGNPLVLKVLGNLLHGKVELWESQLYKLKKEPIKKIYSVMKWSYDDLDPKEQCIFLDLACFFGGLNLEVDYIKILLKDHENDNSVVVVLEALKDKSLINVSEDNIVYMHNIIQAMGWEIARQESRDNPECHSRLIDPDDIYEVLKNDKGTEATRSIRTNLSALTKLKLNPHVFVEMSKLQFIDFHSENEQDGLDILPQGLEYLPTELRYLRWMNYPLKSLPKRFSPEHLVILDLSNSQLETLWHGEPDLVNLKQAILYGSKFLKELPDFSKAVNLELLDIRFCSQLTVHGSIYTPSKLKILV